MSGRRLALASLALLVAIVTAALGVWQVERRAWKHALIARVEARLAAPPVASPPPAQWNAVGAADAYTRVQAAGRYDMHADTFVQAVTDLGPGWWVMTPLITDTGAILINRGFVPDNRRGRTPAPAGEVIVTGLLRVSEPGGGFLRSNDPAAGRWYSRDVDAIARVRGYGRVAPFFIDRDAGAPGEWPRGGLTVVRFADNHLVYALTWFALAALALFFLWRLVRGERGD